MGIYGDGLGEEMNSEEGLRALESLHARLCVLERVNPHRLGKKFADYHSALKGILAFALPTVYRANGQLSQAEQIKLSDSIVRELRQNLLEIETKYTNIHQFEKDMYDEIRDRTITYTNGVPDPYYNKVTDQMISIFERAFPQVY